MAEYYCPRCGILMTGTWCRGCGYRPSQNEHIPRREWPTCYHCQKVGNFPGGVCGACRSKGRC